MTDPVPDMQLYFSPSSPFVRRVRILAAEKGLAGRIELVRKPVRLLQPNREVMQVNPLAKVPVLITPEGQALSDSTTICAYLDTLADGPRLVPTDWMRMTLGSIGLGLCDTLLQRYREIIRPEGYVLPPLIAEFDLKIETTLRYLEAHVDALAEAPFDLAQITVGCAIGYLDYRTTVPAWRATRPALAAWFDTVSRRASFIQSEPQPRPAPPPAPVSLTEWPDIGQRH